MICPYCDNDVALQDMTRDHFIPRSKGGKGHGDNIIEVCRWCNSRKGNLEFSTVEEVREFIKTGNWLPPRPNTAHPPSEKEWFNRYIG